MSDFLDSKQVKIGDVVEDFALPAMDGKTYRLSDCRGSVVVIDFWSAECPISEQYDPFFKKLHSQWTDRGVRLLAIDSNATYGQDKIRAVMEARGIVFPILLDRGNIIADRFGALTTPHVYILDRQGRLAYEGAVDDRSWAQKEARVNYVEQALEAVLQGRTPPVQQTEPFGCTIERQW